MKFFRKPGFYGSLIACAVSLFGFYGLSRLRECNIKERESPYNVRSLVQIRGGERSNLPVVEFYDLPGKKDDGVLFVDRGSNELYFSQIYDSGGGINRVVKKGDFDSIAKLPNDVYALSFDGKTGDIYVGHSDFREYEMILKLDGRDVKLLGLGYDNKIFRKKQGSERLKVLMDLCENYGDELTQNGKFAPPSFNPIGGDSDLFLIVRRGIGGFWDRFWDRQVIDHGIDIAVVRRDDKLVDVGVNGKRGKEKSGLEEIVE
jgi:hypothetical protein